MWKSASKSGSCCVLTLVVASDSQGAEKNPARVEIPERLQLDLAQPPKKGPETERWYFTQWHEPYDAVLSRDHLDQIWERREKGAR